MAPYHRLLLVVDLTEDSVTIGRRAQALAAAIGAEVELLHVVEFVPVEPMGETLMPSVQIEEELLERARQRLPTLARAARSAGCRRAASKAATSSPRSCAWRASGAAISSCSAAASATDCRYW